MPLDNAQFIAELQIDDPPGTDPLDQGDDHIRTTKRATQQSFPNVDAAVPQTAAQMAQMAIKNETNTFTLVNTFQSRIDLNADLRFDLTNVDRGLQAFNSGAQTWDLLFLAGSQNSDFRLGRYTGGVFQDEPIAVERTTGRTTFRNDTIFLDQNIRLRRLTDRAIGLNFQEDFGTNVNRWSLQMTDAAGNDEFRLNRFDTGSLLQDSPMVVSAADGFVTFANRVTAKIDFQVDTLSTASRGYRFSNALGTEVQMDIVYNGVSTTMNFRRYSGGVQIDTPFRIEQADGAVKMTTLPTGPGGLVSGTLYAKPSNQFAPTEIVMGVAP